MELVHDGYEVSFFFVFVFFFVFLAIYRDIVFEGWFGKESDGNIMEILIRERGKVSMAYIYLGNLFENMLDWTSSY